MCLTASTTNDLISLTNLLPMRRLLLLSTLFLLPSLLLAGRDQKTRDLDIKLTILPQGVISVHEKWDIDTGDNITEWYLVRENLDDIEIVSFTVMDDDGNLMENVGEWDVNRSLEEKAGKCGIVHKTEGVELCWGIAPRGDHVFQPFYGMLNAVKSMNDYDMLHLQVVSPGLASPPEHVKVTVRGKNVPLDTLNTRAWGFGFEGSVSFVDSCVVFESVRPFRTDDSAIVLLRFDKDLFHAVSVREGDFQEVLDVALEGASFADDPPDVFSAILGFLVTALLCFFIFIRPLIKMFSDPTKVTRREKRKMLGISPKKVEWYRDIPYGGDLAMADTVLEKLGERKGGSNLPLAEILRMIHKGAIDVREDLDGPVLLSLNPGGLNFLDDSARKLYGFLSEASGQDKILQEDEFSNWARKNNSKVYNWSIDESVDAYSGLRGKGFYTKKGIFTQEGKSEARKLLGLRKFLEDFTLVREREVIETGLWKEYLVYAALFGIADKVAKQLEDIDPNLFKETFKYDYNTFSSVLSTSTSLRTSMNSAVLSGMPSRNYYSSSSGSSYGSSRSGYGGHTSSGGGSGFSGGGRGGGGR